MKMYLMNTARGLMPMTDEDYEAKKKLRTGEVYKVEIKLARNYNFHKKYFALINCAWHYLNEANCIGFGNAENFRKYVEVAAGWYDIFYHPTIKDYVQVPKSISFDNMKAEEFSELYDSVKDVLWRVFLKGVTHEEFERNLSSF